MTFDAGLRARIKAGLPEKKFNHLRGVMLTARRLARRYGSDSRKAVRAARLHDAARGWNAEQLGAALAVPAVREVAAAYAGWGHRLEHAPAAAGWASQAGYETDPEVLAAVAAHPTGRAGWNQIGFILFLADYLEPTRTFAGVVVMRERLAALPLREAVLAVVTAKIEHLRGDGRPVHPWALAMQAELQAPEPPAASRRDGA